MMQDIVTNLVDPNHVCRVHTYTTKPWSKPYIHYKTISDLIKIGETFGFKPNKGQNIMSVGTLTRPDGTWERLLFTDMIRCLGFNSNTLKDWVSFWFKIEEFLQQGREYRDRNVAMGGEAQKLWDTLKYWNSDIGEGHEATSKHMTSTGVKRSLKAVSFVFCSSAELT